MEIWQGVLDFVLCWLKLAAIATSVPLTLTLLYRYCGAPYVLERKERKLKEKKQRESDILYKERSEADDALFLFKPKEASQLQLYWHPRRENLYLEYRKEMDDMQGLRYNEQLYKADLLDFLDERNNVWVPIVHNNEEIGFICMCAPPCCHPDADWFLREAYIRPEFRRQGLMRKTLLMRLRSHPGRYCLFIMENNTPAQKCWHSAFQSAGYVPMELRKLAEFKDITTTLYSFKPKEET